MLFTLGALKKIQTGCLLTVSDVVVEGEFKRITDEDMRAAVDQMTELALGHGHRRAALSGRTVFLVNPASAGRGDRPPLAGARPAAPRARPRGRRPVLRAARAPAGARRGRRPTTAPSSSSPSAATAPSTRSPSGIVGTRRRELAVDPARHRRRLRPHVRDPVASSTTRSRSRSRGATREIDAGRVGYRAWSGETGEAWFVNVAGVGMSGAVAKRTNESSKALGGKVVVPLVDARRLRALAEHRGAGAPSTARSRSGTACTRWSSPTAATSAAG